MLVNILYFTYCVHNISRVYLPVLSVTFLSKVKGISNAAYADFFVWQYEALEITLCHEMLGVNFLDKTYIIQQSSVDFISVAYCMIVFLLQ